MYSWTCELCNFIADTPEAKAEHALIAVHTPEQTSAFFKSLDAKMMEAAKAHFPTDIDSKVVHSRAAALLSNTNLSRTTALALLLSGAIRAAFVGLTKEEILGTVGSAFDTLDGSDQVRAARDVYAETNKLAKEQATAAKSADPFAGLPLMAPKTDIVH